MKNSILIIAYFFSISVSLCQVRFVGSPLPVQKINSSQGQNYLTIDPFSENMAFTEERGGMGNESSIEEKSIDSATLYLFTDWLNTPGMTSPIGFDSDFLYYSQVSLKVNAYQGSVKRVSLETGKIEEVSIPFMKNKSSIQSGTISANGRFMILSMESNNTKGVEDLYVSKRGQNGEWSSFSNLGGDINTEYQEITPFLANDNKTLFFATNGRGGEGSYDLFYSERLDDSWRNWSKPVNLGPKINSSGSETSIAFRDNAKWAYFVSSQDSDGYGDVMRIEMEEDIEPDTVPQQLDTSIAEEKPQLTATQTWLKIVDAATKESISATLLSAEFMQVERLNGIFQVDSLLGLDVEIKSKGYLSARLVLDTTFRNGTKVVELNSVAKGKTVTLDHVLFHRGTSKFKSGSEKELDLVVEALSDNPGLRILLKGHTDNTGDPVKNVRLSEERVKTVKTYLISKGISAYRVQGKGYGGNLPVASNATEETRKLNRRVEFEVLAD